jgi:hypothetical protein
MFKGWTKGANDQAEVWFCRVAFLSPGSSYIMHILCIYSIPMNINSLDIVSPQEDLSASGDLKGSVDNLSEGKEGKVSRAVHIRLTNHWLTEVREGPR